MNMRMLGAVFEFEHDLLIERTNASIVRSLAEGTALSRLSALTRTDAWVPPMRLGGAGRRCARSESTTLPSSPSGWTEVSRTGLMTRCQRLNSVCRSYESAWLWKAAF